MRVRHSFVTSRKQLSPNTSNAQQAQGARTRVARERIARAARLEMELLETRRLLTTLHGGDTFEFQDAQGAIERVKLTGDITAELIGSRVSTNNTVSLINLPGTLNGVNVNGGINASSGTQTIGSTTVADPQNSGLGSTSASIAALAASPSGALYGVNVTSGHLLQIVQFNTTTGAGTVVAEVSTQALALAGTGFNGTTPTITGATAAAFNPIDGRLNFVATGGTSNIPKLFSVNVSAGSSAAIQQSLTAVAGTFGAVAGNTLSIGAIAFDQTGPGTARLIASRNGGTAPQILTVDQTNTDNITGAVALTGTTTTGSITGLAFNPDNVNAANPTVLATVGGQLLNVTVATGAATPAATIAAAGQGANIGDITFDPTLVNPFTNTQGALVGTDTATNTLFFVNQSTTATRDSIFAIYVSSSDTTGSISVAQVTAAGSGQMEPYSGTIGSLVVNSPATTSGTGAATATIAAPAGSGEALLGARTTGNVPILTAQVSQSFGVLPSSITTLHSGLIVANGQNMNNFLFGGTVLGQVQIHGSINTFYAGWLLTGDARGAQIGTVSDPQNFLVDGDLRNLLVRTDIGTDDDAGVQTPDFLSGFDLRVGGTLGSVQAGGSLIGSVNGEDTTNNLNTDQTEIENRNTDAWDSGSLGSQLGDTYFNNDTFATAQYISESNNATTGLTGSVVVDGSIQDDPSDNLTDKVDYYAVPLLAGQTITVAMTQSEPAPLVLDTGVFDPSGREIATDYNATDLSATQQKAFQFTATDPGVYRFAVGVSGNGTFAAGGGTATSLNSTMGYRLSITNVGTLGVGNIVAGGNLADNPASASAGFGAANGDLGSLVAGGTFFSFGGGGTNNTVVLPHGSLRVVTAAGIGIATNPNDLFDPEISIPNGSVGLLQSAGFLDINSTFDESPAIGGNYQDIIAGGNLGGEYIANGRIGTIQAASVTEPLTEFRVNRDNVGDDGTIDLIDVSGDFGTMQYGGPQISTGNNGDVRYMHIGGTVYRDTFFGASAADQATTYSFGSPAQLTDDSGATVTITPNNIVNVTTTTATTAATDVAGTTVTRVVGSDGSVTTTTTTKSISGANTITQVTTSTTSQLTVLTYGIEGSGGSAIVNVTATGGVSITGSGGGGAAEIGTLETTQTVGTVVEPGASSFTSRFGNGTTLPLLNAPTLDTATPTALDVTLSGPARLDVFQLEGGEFSSITNSTSGELVDVTAASVGTLTGGSSLGIPTSNTGAAIRPSAVFSNTYPFVQQHTGINITGSAVSISASRVGNINVGGSVGNVSGTIAAPVVIGGSVRNVNIGSGITSSGTGAVGLSGLYVGGEIGPIAGSNGANIRGNVLSNTGITSINLNNGSVINSVIGNVTDYSSAIVFNQNGTIPGVVSSLTAPTLDIGQISTTGVGGIIGDQFVAEHIGDVSVGGGGFGILESDFNTTGAGTIGSLTADGYGIRDVDFTAGAAISSINATGNGSLSSVANYSGQVRLSESNAFDPNFGTLPNITTDLDAFLGTTPTTPVIPNVTDTGVIEDCLFSGSRDLGSVRAYEIRSTDPALDPTVFNFANSIGSIVTTSLIDGMTITTGKLGTFSPGGDVMHGTLQIAGTIKNLVLHGNFRDSSTIRATGRNGNIKSLVVMGNLDGTIEADGGKITKAVVDGALDGSIISKTLASLVLRGTLGNGALQIAGNVNSITTTGDLGATGDTLTINGKLGRLTVGGNLYANVTVGNTLGNVVVKGSVISGSTLSVAKVFSTLRISGDFQAGATVRTARLKRLVVRGANAGSVVLT